MIENIRELSDEQLIGQLKKLVKKERAVTLAILTHLIEDDYLKRHSAQQRAERRKKRKARQRAKQASKQLSSTMLKVLDDPTKLEGHRKERSRHISQAVKDAVFLRDGGRCTYVSSHGVRCEETSHLQYEHIQPYALGGENGTANIRLACACHNRYFAEMTYGREHMRQFHAGE